MNQGTSLSVLFQVVISGCLLFFIPLNGSLPHIPHPASSPGPRAVSTADTVPGHRAGHGSLTLAQWNNGSRSSWTLGCFCELRAGAFPQRCNRRDCTDQMPKSRALRCLDLPVATPSPGTSSSSRTKSCQSLLPPSP